MTDLIHNSITKDDNYKNIIYQIKDRIQSSQMKASLSVNKELLDLYWFIASTIVDKQKKASWGDGLVKEISKDLQKDFLK